MQSQPRTAYQIPRWHNMQLRNRLKLPLLISLSLCLLSCCTPNIPNVYVFQELDPFTSIDPTTGDTILNPSPACEAAIQEPLCGHGTAIISGSEIYVGETHLYEGKKWSELKAESILVPAIESYAPLEIFMINSCKKTKCSALNK